MDINTVEPLIKATLIPKCHYQLQIDGTEGGLKWGNNQKNC